MPLTNTPAHVIEQWHLLGLSSEALARIACVDVRTLERWRGSESYPQHEARRHLAALEELHRHLLDVFESEEDARLWLHADSRYLGGLRPTDALVAGRLDRVEAALEAIDSGIFT